VYVSVNATFQTVQVWTQTPSDSAPVPVSDSIPFEQLGEFQPVNSSLSQRRAGPSPYAILYFGNGGSTGDVLEFSDWCLYPTVPIAVDSGEGTPGHSYAHCPDLPVTYFAADNLLPTDQKLGRWTGGGSTPILVEPWYQPGKKTAPLYAVLRKESTGDSFIYRKESRLSARQDGFSVEAWFSGSIDSLSSPSTGIGLRIDDGLYIYQLTALDNQLHRSLGVLKNASFSENLTDGYYTVLDATGNLSWVDYRTLKLVRLTLDRSRGQLLVFVEDMDTPFMSLPLTGEFPATMASDGVVSIGIFNSSQLSGEVHLASLSYLNRYDSWEFADGLPTGAPKSFELVQIGDGLAAQNSDGHTTIYKANFGSDDGSALYYHLPTDFSFERGFQVDFRAKVISYTDQNGVSNAPNFWTGVGLTLYLGSLDSPLAQYLKIHLGFFDCGVFGRKIGIVPGSSLQEQEIIQQTKLGKRYSADADWMMMQSYRLVYRPHHGVEVYSSNFIKDDPIISIPWEEFSPQLDGASTNPSIALGNFNSLNSCRSEWEYLRWGVSSGHEIELTQESTKSSYYLNSFGGRALAIIDAQEAGGTPGPTVGFLVPTTAVEGEGE
jgi:hypothetical protein